MHIYRIFSLTYCTPLILFYTTDRDLHSGSIVVAILLMFCYMHAQYITTDALAKWELSFQRFGSIQLPSSGNNDRQSTHA